MTHSFSELGICFHLLLESFFGFLIYFEPKAKKKEEIMQVSHGDLCENWVCL